MLERRLGSISDKSIKVIYDHGRKRMPKVIPYFGHYSTASTLSNLDCAVVRKNRILALCEIEEETATPKRIIGDICNVFMADRIRIGGDDFEFEGAHMFIGLRTREDGRGEEKAVLLKGLIANSIKKKMIHGVEIHIICDTKNDALIHSVADEIVEVVDGLRNRNL
jgi:hypothetical protein